MVGPSIIALWEPGYANKIPLIAPPKVPRSKLIRRSIQKATPGQARHSRRSAQLQVAALSKIYIISIIDFNQLNYSRAIIFLSPHGQIETTTAEEDAEALKKLAPKEYKEIEFLRFMLMTLIET